MIQHINGTLDIQLANNSLCIVFLFFRLLFFFLFMYQFSMIFIYNRYRVYICLLCHYTIHLGIGIICMHFSFLLSMIIRMRQKMFLSFLNICFLFNNFHLFENVAHFQILWMLYFSSLSIFVCVVIFICKKFTFENSFFSIFSHNTYNFIFLMFDLPATWENLKIDTTSARRYSHFLQLSIRSFATRTHIDIDLWYRLSGNFLNKMSCFFFLLSSVVFLNRIIKFIYKW